MSSDPTIEWISIQLYSKYIYIYYYAHRFAKFLRSLLFRYNFYIDSYVYLGDVVVTANQYLISAFSAVP